MSDISLQDSLLALAKSDNRSKKARIREQLDAIETAIAAGVAYSSITAVLADHGIKMTVQSLSATLVKLRQERALSAADKHWTTDVGDAESASQPTHEDIGSAAATTMPKATTPRTIRQIRQRTIDLESLVNS